jgi:hypothetical protein
MAWPDAAIAHDDASVVDVVGDAVLEAEHGELGL